MIDTHAEGRYQEVSNAWRYAKLQTTETYLGLLRERGKRGLPIKRIYRQLYNTNLYLSAYGRIYRNAGAMTPGVTDETADSTSLETFDHHSSTEAGTVSMATSTANLHLEKEREKEAIRNACVER